VFLGGGVPVSTGCIDAVGDNEQATTLNSAKQKSQKQSGYHATALCSCSTCSRSLVERGSSGVSGQQNTPGKIFL